MNQPTTVTRQMREKPPHYVRHAENAERFVKLLSPVPLQEWYRVELGSIPRDLYAVKLQLLNELADVLDAKTLKFLSAFLTAYKEDEPFKVLSKCRAFLALLVVPDTTGPVVRELRQKIGL